MKETVMPGVECWFRVGSNPIDPRQPEFVLMVMNEIERSIYAYHMGEETAARLYFDVGRKLCEHVPAARLLQMHEDFQNDLCPSPAHTVLDSRPPRQQPRQARSRGLWARLRRLAGR